MATDARTPLASFEAKWQSGNPEFGMALRFVAPRERAAQSAFHCLVFELEQAAFATRDAEPAAIKLQWWAEELTRAGNGEARHPLTLALAAHAAFAGVAPAQWYAAIRGALAQRDPEPAGDHAALLAQYALFYAPLASIEGALFARGATAANAAAYASARALRDVAALAESLRSGRLPLPLDVLARHRLARGDLVRASPDQVAALRDWIGALATEFRIRVPDAAWIGPVNAARAAAMWRRAHRAASSDEPLATLQKSLHELPTRAVWAAWRAGRRSSG